MCGTRSVNHHATLVARMAETLGLDLSAALSAGQISSQEWRDAVVACCGCSQPGACQHWLAEQQPGQAEATPDYCENQDMMARLRDQAPRASGLAAE